MSIFLIVVMAVYSAMNSYLFWKVHLAFRGMGRWLWVLAAFLLLMIAGPILVRLVDRAGQPRLADDMGVVAHSWLAIIFWFCCVAIVLDLWNLGASGMSHWSVFAGKLVLGPRPLLIVAAMAVATAVVWGVIEANNIQLNAVTIRSAKLPPGAKPIRIVQISDMHIGGGTSNGRLAKALRIIDEAKPDLIVSTGDLGDSPYDNIKDYAAMLAQVNVPLGKYAICGNHEYYVGLDEAAKFNEAAGFVFLRGQSAMATRGLCIAGADDPAGQFRRPAPPDPLPVSVENESECFVLLLKHRPTIHESSLGRFDLQLSGHTHGGQLFPFNFVIGSIFKYSRGGYHLDKGSELLVSRGTGTWGPPMRLGAPPEVILITIEPLASGKK